MLFFMTIIISTSRAYVFTPLIYLDLTQSILKPWHAEILKEIYKWLLTGQENKYFYRVGGRPALPIESSKDSLGW